MSKKIFRNLLIFILVINFTFFGTGCDIKSKPADVQSRFEALTNDMFVQEVQSDTLSLNFSLADPKKYGIKETSVTLGDYGIDQMNENLSMTENYIKRLKGINYEELTPDQQLTYDILKNYMDVNLKFGDYLYYTETLGPTTGIQAQLPILLAEFNFYTKDDIDRYIELLPCVYDYFKDIAAFEREKSKRGLFMSDSVADSIIEQCEAFIKEPENNFLIDYFNDKVSAYEGLTKDEIAEYKEENKKGVLNYVIPSYELIIDVLKELKGTGVNKGGLCSYPAGKEYYELLAKQKIGTGKDIEEIIKMLDKGIGDELLKVTKLTLSDPAIMNKYEAFKAFPITDPKEIITDLKKDITKDFPAPVPVNCTIKYVDESLSDYLSPAMYLMPAIDSYKENNIYINGKDEETLSKIYTTVAHEGYPGHLYQCVYFRSHNPAPIRSLFDFLGYDEGWATYVEYYSYHIAGIDESLASLLEANNAAVLFMYARADIGIHYEGWSEKKAVAYFKAFVNDAAVAKSIYETLLEEPAIYLPYAVGYLEITKLREKAEAALGDKFAAKEFHEFLLDIGPAQFDIIEDHINAWIKEKSA